jgi:NAD(P)-dependent dehydrogenase (short-subunit alcohol dehydrogenase family)
MESQLQGKTVLITGGTGGIGKATALGLAKLGAKVIITGRDQARGAVARKEIADAAGNPQIELLLADLTSQAEVRRLVAEVAARHERLDILINNAGLLEAQRRLTVDGVEAHFAMNVVTPFLLTHMLFNTLQRSAPARVINLTGGMPVMKIDLTNLQAEKSFRGLVTYTNAKAVMMAMSYEFAQRSAGSGVAINVAYPGSASTAMSNGLTRDMVPFVLQLAWPIFSASMRNDHGGTSAARAARSSIYLASAPEVEGVGGRYYDTNSKLAAWPRDVLDAEKRAAIWQECERLTGVSSSFIRESNHTTAGVRG